MFLRKRSLYISASLRTELPPSQNCKKLRKEQNQLNLQKFGSLLIQLNDSSYSVSNQVFLLKSEKFLKNQSNSFLNICCFPLVQQNHPVEILCQMRFFLFSCLFSQEIIPILQLCSRNCLRATKAYSSEEFVSSANTIRE